MAAATPPHAVVVCPPSRHVSSSRQRRERNPVHPKTCWLVVVFSVFAAVIAGFVLLVVFTTRDSDPVYSVAITGVAGLDDPARGLSAGAGGGLSPAFNLTLHVDNTRNSGYRACVPDGSTVAVSYGDAFLANGTVPPLCAEEKRESERVAATARGDAVAVPRHLRDQMAGELAAGEASVDVKVTMPKYSAQGTCGDAVLSCKAKIGVGAGAGPSSSPCRLDYVKTSHDEEYYYFYPPPFSFMWPPIFMHE